MVEFTGMIPKTPIGKVNRKALALKESKKPQKTQAPEIN